MFEPKNLEAITEKMIEDYGYKSTKGKAIATGVGVVVTALATTALINVQCLQSSLLLLPEKLVTGQTKRRSQRKAEAEENILHQPVMDVTLTQNGYKNNKTDKNSKIA